MIGWIFCLTSRKLPHNFMIMKLPSTIDLLQAIPHSEGQHLELLQQPNVQCSCKQQFRLANMHKYASANSLMGEDRPEADAQFI